jgi:hypothetical protein
MALTVITPQSAVYSWVIATSYFDHSESGGWNPVRESHQPSQGVTLNGDLI